MNDVPPPRPAPRPFDGFATTFAWGLLRVVRWKKVLLIALAATAFGAYIGIQIRESADAAKGLAQVLDRAVLAFGLPVIALLLAGEGFAYELQAKTLVYHLTRPIRRTTLFLARFLSGVVPAAMVVALVLTSLILASGVGFTPKAWTTVPIVAGLGTLTLAAIYYTLGTVFKNGFVIGLVYTFFIETALTSVPGAMQRYSVMHHIRSLHHLVTEGVLPKVIPHAKGGLISEKLLLKLTETPNATTATLTLVIVTVVVLSLGAWVTARRDFALK